MAIRKVVEKPLCDGFREFCTLMGNKTPVKDKCVNLLGVQDARRVSELGIKWKPIGTWLAASAGVCSLFEKGIFYGDPRDALAYARKNQAKFGEFKGFIIGEVIRGGTRILFEFYREDARSRRRKDRQRSMRHLKKRGIRRWQYERYLEKNPLERYLQGKPPLRRHTSEESLAFLKKRDKTNK